MGNVGVTYNDPGVDAGIQRVAYDSQAHKRLEKYFTPKGDVGATKIVSLHTDGDGLVIVEQEQTFTAVVPAANLTTAIVDEPGNTHCGFNALELVAGWESLRGWIAGGPQPTAASIQGLCLFLGGGATCRINPAYVVGTSTRAFPRAESDRQLFRKIHKVRRVYPLEGAAELIDHWTWEWISRCVSGHYAWTRRSPNRGGPRDLFDTALSAALMGRDGCRVMTPGTVPFLFSGARQVP